MPMSAWKDAKELTVTLLPCGVIVLGFSAGCLAIIYFLVRIARFAWTGE